MKSSSRKKPQPKPEPQFRTLREYVDAQPRSVTQNAIAAELGVAHVTLSAWLNDRHRPKRSTALRISRQTGIPLEGLLDPESMREAS